MKIKTYEGLIETPELEDVGERTKFWARAMQDLLRIDEIYCVMAAAQKEAYDEGAAKAFRQFMEELLVLDSLAQADLEEFGNQGKLASSEESLKVSGEGQELGAVSQADGAGA